MCVNLELNFQDFELIIQFFIDYRYKKNSNQKFKMSTYQLHKNK